MDEKQTQGTTPVGTGVREPSGLQSLESALESARGTKAAVATEQSRMTRVPTPAENVPGQGNPAVQRATPSLTKVDSPEKKHQKGIIKSLAVTLLLAAALLFLGFAGFNFANDQIQSGRRSNQSLASNFDTTSDPLDEIAVEAAQPISLKVLEGEGSQFTVNGKFNLNGRMVIAATTRPETPVAGEMWFQDDDKKLYFYDGTQYVDLTSVASLATTVQQVVNSIQGLTGQVDITAGQGIAVNGTTISNTGVISLESGSPFLTITDAGNGRYVITDQSLTDPVVFLQDTSPGAAQSGNINVTGTIIGGGFQGDGGGLTGLNAAGITVGTLDNARLSPDVTLKGNLFNGANQLVELNVASQLPAVSGVNLINLNANNIATGTLFDGRLSTNVTLQGNTFNGADQLVKLNGASELPAVSAANLTNLNATNISSGTLADARLSTNVTVQGNTFNGASQLVQLSNLGYLPAVNASLVTNLNATNIATGTLDDARLSTNVALLDAANQTFTGSNTFSGTVTAGTITSTGTLSVGNTAQRLVLQGDGSSSITANSGAFSTKVGFSGTPSGNVVYNFDMSAAPGTYVICTSIGNCSGGGGSGVTTPGGTLNRLARFSGATSIVDSIIADNGTSVLIAPSTDTVATFNVQDSASNDVFVVDTTNTRVAIGQSTAAYTLDVNGDINSATGLRIGGNLVCDASGCAAAGGSGFYIQNGTSLQTAANFNFQSAGSSSIGGIIRGAAGQTADLFQAQDENGVAVAKITASGNLDISGNFLINGTQISSANLSNDANLAKLNGTQSFTGQNTFQSSTNSLTAFQIQNSTGNSNLIVADTINTRLGVGTATPGYTLDVNGDINIPSGAFFRMNGVPICGPNATCAPSAGSNNYIQNSTSGQTANFNIQSANSGSVTGTIRGASGQTANIFEVQNSSPTTLFAINPTGNVGIGTNSPNARLEVVGGNILARNGSTDATVQLGLQNDARQFALQVRGDSGDSFVIRDNTASVDRLVIDATGQVGIGTTGPAYKLDVAGSANATTLYQNGNQVCDSSNNCSYAPASGSTSYIQNGTSLQSNANLAIQSADANSVGAVIRAAAGQVANIQEWQNSGGATIASVSPTGVGSFTNLLQNGNQVCDASGNCSGAGGGVTTPGGTAGTFAIFTGSQSIADSILSQSGSTITAAGNVTATGTVTGANFSGNGSGLTNVNAVTLNNQAASFYQNASNINAGTLNDAYLSGNVARRNAANTFTLGQLIQTGGISNLGLGIRANSGQTANLQEWQNSAGTALSYVTASGAIYQNGNQVCDASGNCSTAGAAGGDLTGTYPNPTIAKLQGATLTTASLAGGDLLLYNGTAWVNQSVSGDLTISSTGVATIANGAVTNAKLANSSLTVTAGTGLSGGGSVSLGSSTTLNLANTAVTAGAYGAADSVSTFTVDAQGRLTAAGSTAIAIDANQITSGTLTVAQGGTGLDTTPTDGQLLIGDGTGYTLATLTADSGIAITNGAGSIAVGVDSTVCRTTGNCTTLNGQVTTPGGTPGTFAKFSASQVIEDSLLSELGSTVTVAGNLTSTGTITGANFSGNGSGLTNVNAVTLNSQAASFYQNASNINAGTLNDSRLSTNVTVQGNTFNGANQLVQLDASGFLPALNGSALTSLNANNISSGTLNDARLSSNVAMRNQANTFTAGQLIQSGGAAVTLRLRSAVSQTANLQEWQNSAGTALSYVTASGAFYQNGNEVCDTSGNCSTSGTAGGDLTGTYPNPTIAKLQGETLTTGAVTGGQILLYNGTAWVNQTVTGDITISNTGVATIEDGTVTNNKLANSSLTVNAGTGLNGGGSVSLGGSTTLNIADTTVTPNSYGSASSVGTFTVNSRGQLTAAGSTAIAINGNQVTSGTVADARLSTNVTLQGNTFNGVNQLVRLDGSGYLPALNGSALTALNATNIASGTLSDARLTGNVALYDAPTANFTGTLQQSGNDVCTTAGNCSTAGSAGGDLTGTYPNPTIAKLQGETLTTSAVTSGQILLFNGTAWVNQTISGDISLDDSGIATIGTGTVTNSKLANSSLTVTAGTGLTGGGTVSLGDSTTVNLANTAVAAGAYGSASSVATFTVDAQGRLTAAGSASIALNGNQITSGTVADARLSTNVTLQGNTFNGVNQLVQLDGSGFLPALNGSALTDLDASNVATGTLDDARLTGNVALYDAATANFTGSLQQGGNDVCTTAGNCTSGGSAGGDLTGTYPNPTIAKLQGETVTTATVTTGDLLIYNGTAWVNQAFSGDLTVNGTGVATIANGAVTNAKLANSSLTVTAGTGLTGGGVVALGSTTTVNLGNTTVAAGSYGSASSVATFDVDAQGRITSAGNTDIAIAGDQITSGLIDNARLNANVALYDATISNFSGALQQGGYDVCTTSGNCASGGAAGGDLTGTYPNPTIAKLQGETVATSGVTSGDLLIFNGSSWVNQGISGDVAINGSGVSTIQNGAVTNAKLANSSLTVTAGTGLSGGGSVSLGGSTTINLANTTVTANSYGSGSTVATFTVDAQGRLTAAGATSISIAANQITSGTLAVARGGTNATSVGSAGSVAYSSGSAYAFSAAGTASQLLTSGGTGAPTFQNVTALLTAGNNIAVTGTTNATIGTVANPTFSTSVMTPLLTSTGAMAITPGGALTIGATGQAFTVQGTGSSVITANGGGGTTTIGFAGTPTGAVNYNFDRSAAAGTYTICTTVGNCAGTGSGVTTPGGTNGTIAMFTGSQSIANSILTQASGTITVGGNLAVTGSNGVVVGEDTATDGVISFYNATNSNTVSLKAGATATSGLTFTLPTADGASGQCIKTNASGELSFGDCLGGGGGGVASLNSLTGTLAIQGTAGQINVNPSGSTITLNLINTGVTATSYGSASSVATFTVDAQGRLSAAGNTSIAIAGTQITSGTIADARLSANVTVQGNTFNGVNQLVQLDGSGFLPALNGSALTDLNASSIATGTLDDARLSANVALYDAPTANFTGTLQQGGDDVCTTAGNCSTAGAAGGDLTGTYPNPTIAKLQGATLTTSSLAGGNLLMYNGTAWVNQAVSGDLTIAGTGVATIANGAVTNAKLANSSLTVTAGTGLSGGGSVALGSSTTLNLADTTVTGGAYGSASSVATFTVDAQGRLTAAGSTAIAINASQITAGTLGVARGGTGAATFTTGGILFGNGTGAFTSSGVLANGQLLIGDGSGAPTVGTLTAGNGVTITNGAGTITIAADGTYGGFIQNSTALQTTANFNIQSAAAGSIGGIIRGATSQTADLQQWQNSGGTALASVSAAGNFTGGTYNGQTISSAANFTGTLTVASYLTVDTNTLFVDAANNRVGIGTTSPTVALDIVHSGSGFNGARVKSSAANGNARYVMENDAGTTGFLGVYGSTFGTAGLADKVGFGSSGDIIIFSDSNAASGGSSSISMRTGGFGTSQERFRITGTGTVGIGTTTPGQLLDVQGGNINTSGSLMTGGVTRVGSTGVLQNVTNADAGTFFTGGTLGVARGGTGANTLTSGGILFGNGTSAVSDSGVLANGQLLIGDGSGAPTVGTLTAGSGISITNGAGTITIANDGTSGSYIQNGTGLQTTANFNIQSAAASSVGGIIRGATSQTADLMQWQNSAGTSLTRVTSGGYVTASGFANGTILSNVNNSLYATSATNVATVVRGAASQTADLQQWQDSTGAVIARVGANGAITSSTSVSSPTFISSMASNGVTFQTYTTGDTQPRFTISSIGTQGWGPGGSTATDTSLSRSAAGVLTTNGALRLGNSAIGSTQLEVQITSASNKGQIIRGAASQTANLQEWQSSGGTVLANVSASGAITAASFSGVGTALTALNASNVASGTLADARLSNNVALYNAATANFTGTLQQGGNDVCTTAGNCTSAGAAGGDLTGTYPNPTIAKLQGATLTTSSVAAGNFLLYNGTAWVNQSVSGDLTIASTGVATIANGAVTNAKLANSSLTVTAGTGLSGGGSVSLGGSTTINIANTTVTPNSYGAANSVTTFTVNSRGQLTAAGTTPIAIDGNQITAGVVGVLYGGTGADNAADARTNLGAAASGVNNDITELTGLTTALSVGQGGTGTTTTPTNGQLLIGNGTGYDVANLTQGSGILITNGSGTISIGVDSTVCLTSGNCTAAGSAGGDLTGTYPNPTLAKIQGNTITTSSVTGGDLLLYNGSAWVNQALSGDVTISSTGVATIANGSVTNAKLANSSLTVTAGTGLTGGGAVSLGGSTTLNLTNTGVTANSYGAANNVTTFTVDAQGRLSAAGTTAIAIAASQVTSGTLGVARGGTGAASLTAGGILLGNGTSAVSATAVLTNGQLLIGDGSGAPTVGTLTAGSGIGITNGAGSITIGVDSTVCLTSGNCVGSGGYGDILQDGNSFGAAMTLGTNDNFALNFETNGSTAMTIDTSGFVGIGTSTPSFALDVSGQGLLFGSNYDGPGRTDNYRKLLRLFAPHYDNDQEPVIGFLVDSNTTTSIINFGGGTNLGNMPTEIRFNVASNNTTQGGSGNQGILKIAPSGIGINLGSSSASEMLDVDGNGLFSGSVTASSFAGSGAALTSLNGSNISSGTVADARLSGNVALYNAATANFTGTLQQGGNDVCTTAGNCGISGDVLQNGNSFGATMVLGTNDAYGLNLETSGVERVFIGATGNVGIGAASTGAKLEVSGTLKVMPGVGNDLTIGQDGSNNRSNNLVLNDGTNSWWLRANTDVFEIRDNTAGTIPLRIQEAAPTNSLYIGSTGNIGVGTVTPGSYKLYVNGDTNVQGNLAVSGSTVITSAGALQNVTASTSILTSGTLGVARGGTGANTLTAGGVLFGNGTGAIVDSGVLGNGQLLIGDGSGAPTVATLTAGSGVSITNGAGSITISADGTYGGFIQNSTTLQTAANFNIQSAAAGSVGARVRGATSQTANIAEFTASTGYNRTTATAITAGGVLQSPAMYVTSKYDETGSGGIYFINSSNTYNRKIYNNHNDSSLNLTSTIINIDGSSRTSITGDSGDGISLSVTDVGQTGSFNLRGHTGDTKFATIIPSNASQQALVVRGKSSQSGNLQEWQSNGGSVLASVTPAGNFTGGTFNGQTISSSASFTGTLAVATLGTADTATALCRNSSNQIATCTGGGGTPFIQGGNSFGNIATLGTNDNYELWFETNGSPRMILDTNGNLAFTAAASITTASATALTLDSGTTGAVNVGTGANAKTVTVGSTTGTSVVNIQGGTGTATGDINISGQAGGIINLGANAVNNKIINIGSTGNIVNGSQVNIANTIGNATQGVNIGSTGSANNVVLIQGGTSSTAIQMQTGAAGVISLANNTVAATVNIGTGATGVKSINIGGTAANVITIGNTQTAGSVAIGTAMTTGAINIGGTGAQTGAITIGAGTSTGVINIATGTGTGAVNIATSTGARTINLGTGATGAKTVNIGSTASTGTTTIQAGSGGINMATATTFSANGAASTPTAYLNGTWFTGGSTTTTKPQLLVQPAAATSNNWSTAGTGLGVNSATGFTGNLLDMQVNGTSRFKVGYDNKISMTDIYNKTGSISYGSNGVGDGVFFFQSGGTNGEIARFGDCCNASLIIGSTGNASTFNYDLVVNGGLGVFGNDLDVVGQDVNISAGGVLSVTDTACPSCETAVLADGLYIAGWNGQQSMTMTLPANEALTMAADWSGADFYGFKVKSNRPNVSNSVPTFEAQASSGQTQDIIVASNSGGTPLFTVGADGDVWAAGNLEIDGTSDSYIMGSLGLGTTNPQGALTITNDNWISALDAAGTGYINMFKVNSNNEVQLGAALSIDGNIVLPNDAGQLTLVDLPIISAGSGTVQSYSMRVGSVNVLTVYGQSNGSGGAQNTRVSIGAGIAPGYKLQVDDPGTNSVARFTGTGANQCTVNAGTGWSCSSDSRLKTNITNISSETALAKINQVQGVTYNWISDPSGSMQNGFIAQAIQQIFPELVVDDGNGYLSLNKDGLLPYVIGGIQEQQKLINNQQAQISNLQNQVNAQASLFSQGQFANLNISGNASIVNLTVTGNAQIKNLTVTDAATFAKGITVNGHIVTGNTENKETKIEVGAQAGDKDDLDHPATTTITGNDTSGKITIVTGEVVSAGEMAKIVFANAYGKAPNVILTPANGDTAGIQYFVGGTSTTEYTINANTPSALKTYTFYYQIME